MILSFQKYSEKKTQKKLIQQYLSKILLTRYSVTSLRLRFTLQLDVNHCTA